MESLIDLLERAIATPFDPAIAPRWAAHRRRTLSSILDRARTLDTPLRESDTPTQGKAGFSETESLNVRQEVQAFASAR